MSKKPLINVGQPPSKEREPQINADKRGSIINLRPSAFIGGFKFWSPAGNDSQAIEACATFDAAGARPGVRA